MPFAWLTPPLDWSTPLLLRQPQPDLPPSADAKLVCGLHLPAVLEGVVFFSFVIDVYSRAVVGWQFADHMRTDLVLDALRMALAQRGPGANVELVHHSDAGSQGGFNWSSQHLVMEVVRDGCRQASAGGSCDAWADVVAWAAVGCAA